jgi:hypothetical protein
MAFKAEFRAPPPLLAASQQPIKSLAVMKKSGGNDQGPHIRDEEILDSNKTHECARGLHREK